MSRIIDGGSHQAIKHFRKNPAAMAVYWVYLARLNHPDNVAWPSGRGLAKDTGWCAEECLEARRWLVEHQALEPVKEYVRPEWRKLEPQVRARKLNFDKAEYYRPTGYIVVNGKQHKMLYTGGKRDNDGELLTERSDAQQDRASENDEQGKDSLMPNGDGRQSAVDVNSHRPELNTNKDSELDSTNQESTNVDSLDLDTASAASGPESKWGFETGQQAWWAEEDSDTYQITVHEITISRFTEKMIVFTYEFGGETVEKMRKFNALSKTEPELKRNTTPLQDAIAECVFKIPIDAQIGKNLNQRLRDWSKQILTTYPRLTATHFRAAYAWKSPFTSRELVKVIGMLGDYRESLKSAGNGTRPDLAPVRKYIHVEGCPDCTDGMIVDHENKTQQCPRCKAAAEREALPEVA